MNPFLVALHAFLVLLTAIGLLASLAMPFIAGRLREEYFLKHKVLILGLWPVLVYLVLVLLIFVGSLNFTS